MQIVKNIDNKFRDFFLWIRIFFAFLWSVHFASRNEIHVVFDENTRQFDGIFRLTHSYENIGMKRWCIEKHD